MDFLSLLGGLQNRGGKAAEFVTVGFTQMISIADIANQRQISIL